MIRRAFEADALVIGGGMSGLTAARGLMQSGFQPLLLDKGRRAGGRMATRPLAAGRADHGAQFLRARSAGFRALVDDWLQQDLVRAWPTPAAEDAGEPRYRAPGGMSRLAGHLALGVDCRPGVRVVSVAREGAGWVAKDPDGVAYRAEGLVLTPPVPQSLALLDAGGFRLAPSDRAALEELLYDPSLTGMFRVEGETRLPPAGALERSSGRARWVADNLVKEVSPEARWVTLQASSEFSREHLEAESEVILDMLEEELRPLLAPGATVRERQLMRWRYAKPRRQHPETTLVPLEEPSLVFAGDAFGGPRVEGAYLSGRDAAERLAMTLAIQGSRSSTGR